MANKPTDHRPGLRFRKLDLHLHTPASKCFADQSTTADQIVAAALSKGLDGIAITDHNSGAWVDDVRAAAAKTPLVVFPGVEITFAGGKEGVHLIALFDPKYGRAEIESLLGNLGLKPEQYGDITTLVQMDVVNVAKIIRERGGLAILAHANSTRGALSDMRGQQRIQLVQSPYVIAAEGTDFQDKDAEQKGKRVTDLLNGSDPDFKRKLAVYQASDNPTGKGDGQHAAQGIGTRFSYFKMDDINLEGLRQCMIDPDVRIRQDFEFVTFSYPRIARLKVKGGFLDGAEVFFHDGLNSILGAKGAGKSLLIEFLRFVLNQPPTNAEVLADHESKLEVRLDVYGSVEVTLIDETGHSLELKRIYNPAENHPYENNEHFDVAQLFPALFLSQNEIIKISESENEQIAFIDRFFDFRSYQQEISDSEKKLGTLDSQLADALRAFHDLKPIEQQIATATKDIEHLDAALKNPVFDTFSQAESKDRALRTQVAATNSLHEQLTNFRTTFEASSLPSVPESLKNDPNLLRTSDINNAAKTAVLQALDEGVAIAARHVTQMAAEYDKWSPTFAAAKKEYDNATQQGGGDYKLLAQKRAKRMKDLETLNGRATALKERSNQIKDITASRKKALELLTNAYERYSQERKSKCQKIEQEASGRLKIEIHESSNVDEFRGRLMSLKRGSHMRDVEIEKICTKSAPGEFSRAVIRYGYSGDPKMLEEVAKNAEIDAAAMRTLAEFLNNEYRYEDLLTLEYKALPQDRPEIRYNVGQNVFELVGRLSIGQKCTAMLIIALSEGVTPIVIDQPEDSLDIRSIWEDMCTKIRRGKERRQFIFTTHSSSLAVASDTDKFIILEGEATRGRVVYSGSMDHAPVNAEVVKYLEGGTETYRTKYDKYQLER
jgi:ABC-type Na+ transport system ATPase subunit NatA